MTNTSGQEWVILPLSLQKRRRDVMVGAPTSRPGWAIFLCTCFSAMQLGRGHSKAFYNAIHWISRYPVDSTVQFVNIYPLDSSLSVR